MVHGQLFAREFFFAMVADALAEPLFPPRGGTKFTGLGTLAFDLVGIHSFDILIGRIVRGHMKTFVTPYVNAVNPSLLTRIFAKYAL